MLYDSYAWKRELRLKKRQILKYNLKFAFDEKFDLAYHKVESAILYSAFIIRMLIESEKLSNIADAYALPVKKYLPIKRIDRMHNWCDEDCYDWEKSIPETMPGKSLCNQLIHSYVMQLSFEDRAVLGFLVSSDYDRNKGLFEVALDDWLQYMDLVIKDSVVGLEMRFEEKKNDYRITKKERGQF